MRITIRAPQTKGTAASPTKYISERERDEEREGNEHRSLFSAEHDKLSVEESNHVLNGKETIDRNDTLHVVLSLRPDDFEKLGVTDKERSKALVEVIRVGMEEGRDSIKADHLRWVGGIHLNTDNPHAHLVIWREYKNVEHYKQMKLNELPYRWLPKSEGFGEEKVITLSPFLQKLTDELDKQQERFHERNPNYRESIGLARHVGRANDPITEVATPVLEVDDPFIRTETFDKEADRYEAKPPKIEEAKTKSVADARGQQLIQETKLDALRRQQASLENHGEHWKFSVEGEKRPQSIYEIEKRITNDAFAQLRKDGITPNRDNVTEAKAQATQKHSKLREAVQIQMEHKAEQLQAQISDYEKRVSVGRESLGDGNADVVPKLTKGQAAWVKTEAIREGKVDRLALAMEAEKGISGFDAERQQEWVRGQQMLTQARTQGNDHASKKFETSQNKEVINGRSYASAMREAGYMFEKIGFGKKEINWGNLFPSTRAENRQNWEQAKEVAAGIKAVIERKAEGFVQTRETLAGVAAFLKQESRDETIKPTLQFGEYAEIARIAVETRDIGLLKEAQKAEITPDRMSGDDLSRAITEHDQRMQALVVKEERSTESAVDQAQKRGERTTLVVTDSLGQEVAMSLKQSIWEDAQQIPNFRPSYVTREISATLIKLHDATAKDLEIVQDFKEQTRGELGWEYERKGMEREEEREVTEQINRIDEQKELEVERPEHIEQTATRREDIDWQPER